MGADDDTVSGLKSKQALKDCGRGRIGGRNNRSNYADRLCNLLNSVCLVLLDNTAGLGVLVCVINILGCVVVLDNLILYDAHTGLLDRTLGKRNSRLVSRACRRKEDLVYLLLCVGGEDALRLSDALDRAKKTVVVFHNVVNFVFHNISPNFINQINSLGSTDPRKITCSKICLLIL